MPYKINPFTGTPDFYEIPNPGTVTSITSGTGMNFTTITNTGSIAIDITKVPYYPTTPTNGFVKWNGSSWTTDSNTYLNTAGGIMSGYLTLSGAPTSNLHAATKQYVDNIAAGINFHEPVHAATTGNLVANYDNGTGGEGATLTSTTAVGPLVVDSHPLQSLQRVLVWQQSDDKQNGIYDVTTLGDLTTPWVLTRSSDSDNSPLGEIANGDFTFVQQGSTYAGYGFICNSTADPIVIGTDAITYVQFNAGQVVVAGYGLTESTPGTFAVDPTIIATVASLSAYYPVSNPSGFITSAALSPYLLSSTAASTYQPLNTNLTNLSGLTYVNNAFVKMTAAGTFSLDSNTYITSAITTLNTLTDTSQTFATGTTGTDFGITSATGVHTFNLPTASSTSTGKLSYTDWNTFNNKQGAITLTTTGTSGAATLIGNTLNIPQYTGGSPTSDVGGSLYLYNNFK